MVHSAMDTKPRSSINILSTYAFDRSTHALRGQLVPLFRTLPACATRSKRCNFSFSFTSVNVNVGNKSLLRQAHFNFNHISYFV